MKHKFLSVIFLLVSSGLCAQTWVQKTNFPEQTLSGRWSPYAFVLNNKIYSGGGYVGNLTSRRDLWEYDVSNNTWIQKQNVPGSSNRTAAIAFSINGKGYVGLGMQNYNTLSTTFLNDLKEYDPVTNTWTSKASLPDSGRGDAACFVVNDKAYVVGGLTGYPELASNDVWMYDASADQWTPLQAFPADFIYNAISFTANSNGYVVGGRLKNNSSSSSFTSKFMYQYNALADIWTQKADYCDTSGRENGIAFVVNNNAYVGTGQAHVGSILYYYREFCVYNILTDTWAQAPDFPATDRAYAVAVSVNNKAYAGTGFLYNSAEIYFNDWWEFSEPAGISNVDEEMQTLLFPNPAFETINIVSGMRDILYYSIFDCFGNQVASGRTSASGDISISSLPGGMYFIHLFNDKISYKKAFQKFR